MLKLRHEADDRPDHFKAAKAKCISPVMSNFEQTASIAGLMFPWET